jgi:hypothetical protein
MKPDRFTLSIPAAPWLGALLVLASLPGYWLAPKVFFASWLAACWFDLGIVLGALTWLWIHRLTGGLWGDVLRPQVLRVAERLPRVLLLFVPLALGLTLLYPWLGAPLPDSATSPTGRIFLAAWHAPAFLLARCLIYAGVWLAVARRARHPLRRGEAAASLMAHLTLTSLASVDALVALVPGWSSSGFALMVLSGQAFGGAAFIVALACRELRAAPAQPVTDGVPLSRDLGNLLLTAMLVWAYLAFMQLLIIWAENLPREISWYLPRLQTGWARIGVALVVVHLVLPLALLLLRRLKDSPRRLRALAIGLVGAHALDVVWLVLPSVAPHDLAAWWLAPALIAGLALMSFGGPSSDTAGAATRQTTELANARA